MNNIICKVFGHSWYHKDNLCSEEGKERYKRYCARCDLEQYMMYKRYGNTRYYWKDINY